MIPHCAAGLAFPTGDGDVILKQMKSFQLELPDQMAAELEHAVEKGGFEGPEELIRIAVREFIGKERFRLMESQQLQDVAWALREGEPK